MAESFALHFSGRAAAHLDEPPLVLNLFAEGSQIQTYDFVREPHENFTTSQLIHFFIALTKSVAQNIRGVTETHCIGGSRIFLGWAQRRVHPDVY